jgi:sulfoquinovose isomerase
MYSRRSDGWLDRPGHRLWLGGEGNRLLGFYQWAALEPAGGFRWLAADGVPLPGANRELWLNARMVHVFGLAHLLGRPGAAQMVEHGLDYLHGPARDPEHGGWFWSIDDADRPVDDSKQAYGHAFVLLAASTAVLAGWHSARPLLDEVAALISEKFWDEDAGLCRDTYDRGWEQLAPYRGQNANMHMTEAYLAAAAATSNPELLARAARIAHRLIRGFAAGNNWRLPEHYDADWRPVLDYNRADPDNLFRPFGSMVGHWFEWARLLVQLHATDAGEDWMLDAASKLFLRGLEDGWDTAGTGLIFSVDFTGNPINDHRYHWVVAEAIGAAALLWRVTGEPLYDSWYQRFWGFADRFLLDRRDGSWHHELDGENQPTELVWRGKPDVYHAYQATLFASLDPRSGLAADLATSGLQGAGAAL